MSEMTLKPNEKLDVRNILKDLDKYEPKRRGWTWRKPAPNLEMGPFTYHDVSEPLKQSVGLPPAKYFGDIDPQPLPVITTEIASGRFEDDIRRMRMAAWHGADHIMVIRHMGQSHIDGLMEGTPQGIGGVPITRKQVRAQRKALDLIEEELGRRNTTPSVERAVLLRMGISSLETQKIVEGCMDHSLMSHGAGHVVYKLSREKNLSIPEAGHLLAQGKYWDEAAALFKEGK